MQKQRKQKPNEAPAARSMAHLAASFLTFLHQA
jgi:hypothetical protein